MVMYMKDKKKQTKIYLYFLIMALIAFIAYLVIEILNYDSFLNFIPKLLGIILILSFLICFIIISYQSKDKKKGTVIIGSLIITLYSIFNGLLTLKIINLPSDEFIPNFYNMSINDVMSWQKKNNVKIIEKYEYDDEILKDYIISQNESYPTLVKNIDELIITISLGPNLEKEVIIPNFIGMKFDEVIKYIEDNHLSNVEMKYQNDEENIDKVISQVGNGTMKRNDKIVITIGTNNSLDDEIEIIDFTNKSKLYATSWLSKYNFKYEIKEEYDDKIKKDYVISQNVKNVIQKPNEDTIILTVSKGKMTTVPDISNMSVDEINNWVMENDLKVTYIEEYNDEVSLGDVIDSSAKKDDVLSSGDNITITLSKGTMKMPKLTTIDTFTNWAKDNDVKYDIVYENSETVKKDNIIKASHKEGEIIKKDDTIIITVSKGKSVSVPNFVGMNKSSIQEKCSSINLNCSFKYGGLTEKTKKDIATSQSKKASTTVSEGTSLVITLSSGIQEKVNVPSFSGKTKSQIEAQCKSIGITCKFTYQSGYSSTPKDTYVSQSKTGSGNKGSTITITLSKGPAKTYTVIVDANQLSNGNPSATKATLESKLKNNCPGVTFKFTYQKANSGIGYLAFNSDVKVGSNKLTQGKTYNVIINSN